jgi:hypothetical protein
VAAITEATAVATATTTVEEATAVVAAAVELDALSNTVNWSHGNCSHSGPDCESPSHGHIKDVTYADMQKAAAPPAVTSYLLDNGGQY